MDNWDFGPYGKGVEGYVHYNAAHDRAQKNSSGGGGKRPNNNGGCFSCILIMMLPAVSIMALWLAR